jgi:hypothetical protein
VALARDLVFHQNSNLPPFYRGFFLLMLRIESKELEREGRKVNGKKRDAARRNGVI